MKNALRCSALTLAAVTVLATFVGLSVRAEDEKISGDLKKMQGTWVRAGEEGPELKWEIKGDSLKADVDGMVYTTTLTLDPKATPHPTADLKITDGPGNSAGKVSKGIYKFDGDKLIFCVTPPGGEKRPTEFTSSEETHLFALKMEK